MWCATFELDVLSIGKKLERTPDNNVFLSYNVSYDLAYIWPYTDMFIEMFCQCYF